MCLHRTLSLFALVAVAALSSGEIRYTVTPMPDEGKLLVSMSFIAPAGAFEVQMPNWSPGAYMLRDMGRSVSEFHAMDSSGNTLTVEHASDNSWSANLEHAARVFIAYTVPNRISEGAMHYSGPPTYMYLVGRKEEACRLRLDTPRGWKIAIGLDAIGDSYFDYTAPDYDVLADNPVTMGDFIELRYTSHGKPITIAMRGAPRNNVDRKRILRVCKEITDGQGDFFGGLPFSKFIWHFNVTPGQDGGGGLEHLSSTQISLAQGIGPRSIRVLAHEFFHLWNVKRIRSRVLGPFDYTELPETGALYWLEGVTDYYASLLTYRFGTLDQSAFLGDLVSNISNVRNNAARLEVSPYESSMRVGETNNGRGNSNGYQISYYNYGWVTGLVLDIEMRDRTNGERSLDDVMLALWEICKDDKPGFVEEEIRRQYVRFGGSDDFFDDVVMNPGQLPLEEQLARVGYQLTADQVPYVDNGFDARPGFGSGSVTVRRVSDSAASAGLKVGDVVLEINGESVQGTDRRDTMGKVRAALSEAKAGTAIRLKVRRDGEEHEISVVPVEAFRSVWKIEDVANGDEEKLALRKGWITGG
ncbi:MAG: M61 family metallopeptidase [Armatimonadetes bacterium]|nr:M61 family metallopeptidase [Armatimonadota bacterium]